MVPGQRILIQGKIRRFVALASTAYYTWVIYSDSRGQLNRTHIENVRVPRIASKKQSDKHDTSSAL